MLVFSRRGSYVHVINACSVQESLSNKSGENYLSQTNIFAIEDRWSLEKFWCAENGLVK